MASGLSAGLALAAASAAQAAEADTRGGLQALIEASGANVRLSSTGSLCLHVRAGSVTDPGGGEACTTSLPAPAAAGRGRARAKFFLVQGMLDPNVDGLTSTATSTGSGPSTTSNAAADWIAIHFPGTSDSVSGAWHGVSAKVSSTDAEVAKPGRAVGEARDPLELTMTGANALAYTAVLSDVRIKSDSARGRNRLRMEAHFENVSRNGTPVAGPLWTLTLSSQGAAASAAAISVDLTLWSGLGITAAQETAAEAYLRARLLPLASGGFGFEEEVSLFGDESPLAEIVLNHPANQIVRYRDAVAADTELAPLAATAVPAFSVPAISCLVLLLLALAVIGSRRTRRP